MNKKFTYGSLFSGVGGFDMGFDQAGYRCAFQVEWDKHCQSVLTRHWPDVPRWSDVQDVDGSWLSHVDVLIFGSPCQDLSVAGKRAGINGGRSSMFFEATRIIKEMRNATGNTYPRVVVWENVPGALSSNRGADFQAVLNEMADCGSHLTEWAVLDAQHFGVPQRRRRIFLVAVLDPAIARNCPDPLLPVAPGRRGDYAKGIKTGEDIAGTLGDGSGSRGWSPDTDRMTFIPEVVSPLQARMSKGLDADGVAGQTVAIFAFTAQRVGEAPRIYEDSTPALLSRMGTGGNNTPMVTQPTGNFDEYNFTGGEDIHQSLRAGTRQSTGVMQAISFGWQENFYAGETHDEITTALTTTKTQAIAFSHYSSDASPSEEIVPTLRAGTNGTGHAVLDIQYAVRRLTPLECERLMGWPDDHTRWTADGTEQADSHRYKQCGNGVATPVARWVAKQIGGIL